jgi:anti-sigma factor RsiW
MKCEQILETLPDLAAGMEVAAPDVSQHLQSCAACASRLDDMRKTMALLDEWQAPEPSPYFDVRLQARLREEAAKPAAGWMQWLRRPALALALTVLVGVGVLLVSKKSSVVTPSGTNDVAQTQASAPGQTQDVSQPGTAVGDLQALDNNDDLYADFDVLDDLRVQQDVTANP